MDISDRGNGERPKAAQEKTIAEEIAFFEEEPLERPRRSIKINSFILLLAGVITTLFCLAGAVEVNLHSQRERGRRDLTKLQWILYLGEGAWALNEELTRYEKNLQRFFIHYDGFDPDSFREVTAATENEIERLKIEHEIIYQQAAREIMDSYNQRLKEVEANFVREEGDFYGGAENGYFSEDTEPVYVLPDGSRLSVRPAGAAIPEEYGEYTRLIGERDAHIAEAREKYLISDEQAAGIIEQSKQESSVYDVSNYYEIKAYLEGAGYFRYCLKNAKTGEYFTNIPRLSAEINPLEYAARSYEYYISVQDDFFSTFFNDAPLNESFKNAGISGYIIIPEDYGVNNPVAAYFDEKNFADSFYNALGAAVILFCAVAAAIWLTFIKSDKRGVKRAREFAGKLCRRLPLIVKAGLFIAAFAVVFEYSDAFDTFYYGVYGKGLAAAAAVFGVWLLAAAVSSLYLLLCLTFLWELVKKPSLFLSEPEIKWVRRFFKSIGLVYRQHVLGVSLAMTFLIVSYAVVQLALAAVILGGPYMPFEIFIACEIIINLLALYVFGLVTAIAKTNRYVDAIIAGNLEIEINERGLYRGVINKLNRLRGGVRRVVVEKNKSEKLKADLITNVSHDLKTPLTSIINYIELLKSPQISDENKAEYIDILDRKAQRVKLLIDDLFEATKLSSGQITLRKEHIDVVGLLKQAVGELEEKFVAAGISLKLTYSDESVPVVADGKKLWRVFENLFTNIIKYSQPGTRAYVDVCVRGGFAEVAFKNISFYEMNFEYSELFERFKRGDAARSTEGSGLGLSIAKDIVELHEGTLEIFIDGDLFKVVVRLHAE